MSMAITREGLQRRIAALEARHQDKPLGPMALADLEHARAALAAFGSERSLPAGKRAKKPKRKKPPTPLAVKQVVSGGLPGLSHRGR